MRVYNVFEMADSKKAYARFASSQRINIFDHLMLTIWCGDNKKHIESKNNVAHWKSELYAFVKDLSDVKLKQGGVKTKEKILVEELLISPDLIEIEDVRRRFKSAVNGKYLMSGMDTSMFYVTDKMFVKYTESINKIIHLCANSDTNTLADFIREL